MVRRIDPFSTLKKLGLPGALDLPRVDAEQPLSQIAERTMAVALNVENSSDLMVDKNALADENLAQLPAVIVSHGGVSLLFWGGTALKGPSAGQEGDLRPDEKKVIKVVGSWGRCGKTGRIDPLGTVGPGMGWPAIGGQGRVDLYGYVGFVLIG